MEFKGDQDSLTGLRTPVMSDDEDVFVAATAHGAIGFFPSEDTPLSMLAETASI